MLKYRLKISLKINIGFNHNFFRRFSQIYYTFMEFDPVTQLRTFMFLHEKYFIMVYKFSTKKDSNMVHKISIVKHLNVYSTCSHFLYTF